VSHEFKPGDLALIVNCEEPNNIGKCVELVELVEPGATYRAGRFLIQNTSGVPVWHVVGEVTTSCNVHVVAGHTQKVESRLMPLRGDLQPEGQKSQEVPA
jgi:hypothetical protein